jgi:hypothetical protein
MTGGRTWVVAAAALLALAPSGSPRRATSTRPTVGCGWTAAVPTSLSTRGDGDGRRELFLGGRGLAEDVLVSPRRGAFAGFGAIARSHGLAEQPDGKLVAAGTVQTNVNDVALARVEGAPPAAGGGPGGLRAGS